MVKVVDDQCSLKETQQVSTETEALLIINSVYDFHSLEDKTVSKCLCLLTPISTVLLFLLFVSTVLTLFSVQWRQCFFFLMILTTSNW